MASPFHRGLPITFKATAVSNLLLGRRGRPLTAKFNEFRTKRCSHGLVHGKLFRKTKGFAMDLSQHFAASEVESPVGPCHPSIKGASILLRSPTPALADRFAPTLQPGASEPL